MKPDCLKPCVTCDKMLIDHTPKEIHEHYGFCFLIEYLNERRTKYNSQEIDRIIYHAGMIENQIMLRNFTRMKFSFFNQFS